MRAGRAHLKTATLCQSATQPMRSRVSPRPSGLADVASSMTPSSGSRMASAQSTVPDGRQLRGGARGSQDTRRLTLVNLERAEEEAQAGLLDEHGQEPSEPVPAERALAGRERVREV